LVIVGTDDVIVPTANSLVIAGKIPGGLACADKRSRTLIDASVPRTI
jgi:hypothetical protein